MAKPEAPKWLREAFRDGIDEREMVYRDGVERFRKKKRPYAAANPWCWLAQFDPKQLPCAGQPGHFMERFHFLRRQTVEEQLGLLLPTPGVLTPWEGLPDPAHSDSIEGAFHFPTVEAVLFAAWDPRNGGFGCEGHHRRFDHQAGSPTAPVIDVPAIALPDHVREFVDYWALDRLAEDRFEGF